MTSIYKGPSIDSTEFARDWVLSPKKTCSVYQTGFARLEYKDRLPPEYIVQQFIFPLDKGLPIPVGPYLFVIGIVSEETPVLGISFINPGEFGNGHALLTKFMEKRLGTSFSVILAGELKLYSDSVDFLDRSGHFYQFLYPRTKEFGKDRKWVNFLMEEFGPYFVSFLKKSVTVPEDIDYSDEWLDIDGLENKEILKHRICNSGVNYDIYATLGDCESEKNPVIDLCSPPDEIRMKVAERRRHILKSLEPEDIERLIEGKITTRDDAFFRVLKTADMKNTPGEPKFIMKVAKNKLGLA